MKVRVNVDTKATSGLEVPAGSVLQQVTELKTVYKGIWCWMMGSYSVSIKKDKCSKIR